MISIRSVTGSEDLLRQLLKESAETFRRYETLHRAKNTPESTQKAEVNHDIARRIEAVLAVPAVPLPYYSETLLEAYKDLAAMQKAEIDQLREQLEQLQLERKRLQVLIDAAGHCQDGSNTTVRLMQDDATGEYLVVVGTRPGHNTHYSGGSFRGAIDKLLGGNHEYL
jgi:multidrug efflux pump subunit AcrA (membrane-fusion protein)